MKRRIVLCIAVSLCAGVYAGNNPGIYKKGWIDFNKNGVKDIYEDPSAPIEARVQDLLSQMTVEEKTCQMATLYGSGRVLKDSLPTEKWKDEIWKDGIANIDEQANGLGRFGSSLSYPYVNLSLIHISEPTRLRRPFSDGLWSRPVWEYLSILPTKEFADFAMTGPPCSLPNADRGLLGIRN